ncbi:MAG: hypothetical protein KBA26_10730 [Candidatus Delongbacteria bacterium]|nr:hypothetical protein [Candidatus Delongbacteria bacterium]
MAENIFHRSSSQSDPFVDSFPGFLTLSEFEREGFRLKSNEDDEYPYQEGFEDDGYFEDKDFEEDDEFDEDDYDDQELEEDEDYDDMIDDED